MKADASALLGTTHQHKDGDAYSFETARYAHGKILMWAPANDGLKSTPATLAEYHGGKWTNREKGYIVSHAQALKIHQCAQLGYHGSLFGDRLYDSNYKEVTA